MRTRGVGEISTSAWAIRPCLATGYMGRIFWWNASGGWLVRSPRAIGKRSWHTTSSNGGACNSIRSVFGNVGGIVEFFSPVNHTRHCEPSFPFITIIFFPSSGQPSKVLSFTRRFGAVRIIEKTHKTGSAPLQTEPACIIALNRHLSHSCAALALPGSESWESRWSRDSQLVQRHRRTIRIQRQCFMLPAPGAAPELPSPSCPRLGAARRLLPQWRPSPAPALPG